MKSRIAELMSWEDDLLAEQGEISRQLEPLLRRKEELRNKLELVQRLKSLESDSPNTAVESSSVSKSQSDPTVATSAGAELQAAVQMILSEKGQALHIRDIRTELAGRGVPIPGRGTDANIIVHLRRAPELFVRSSRGFYGLADWKNGRRSGARNDA